MISVFLNAIRPSCKTLRSAPLLAASLLLYCATSYATPPKENTCRFNSTTFGYWGEVEQVDHLTTTEGAVLAKARMNLYWNYTPVGTDIVETLVKVGGIVLNSSNGNPSAANYYTVPSDIPGVGIRVKDNVAASFGRQLYYLIKAVPTGTFLTMVPTATQAINQIEFQLVLTDIDAFKGGTQGTTMSNAYFSMAAGSAAAWAQFKTEGDRISLSQNPNLCFAYHDINITLNTVTLNPPLNPTCEIRPNSSFQYVFMPTLSLSQLPRANNEISKDFAEFTFALHKCRKGTAPYISLKDLTDPTNITTNLTISNIYGDRPKGLAIRLLRQDSDNTWKDVTFGPSPLTIDGSLPNQFAVGPAPITNAVIEIPFRAHYVRTGNLSAGYTDAKAVIEVMYK